MLSCAHIYLGAIFVCTSQIFFGKILALDNFVDSVESMAKGKTVIQGKCVELLAVIMFPFEPPVNLCQRSSPGGKIGWHWLAGNSKGNTISDISLDLF